MKNKLPKYLCRSWLLSLTLLLAMAPTMFAQSNPMSIRNNSTTVNSQSNQFPAAYYNSSWTVAGERINGVGNVTVMSVNPNNFITSNTSTSSAPESILATVVYDNGPHFNQAGTPNLSILESTTLGMNSLGANIANASGYGISDGFELVAETEITSISVYAYQTGAATTTINGMFVRIWDGDPSNSTSVVVWGNNTTNVFGSVENSGAYRVSETTLTDRSRMLQKVNANISGLTLDAGTYWLEYSLSGTASSGPWQPPVVILGNATTGNALQRTATGWQPWIDTGSLTPQGVPFQIEGIEAGGGGTGSDCEQDFAFLLDDGIGDLKTLLLAEDFEIDAGTTMSVEKVTYRIFNNIGLATTIAFYKDNAGIPGNLVETFSNVAPDSQTAIGTNYGFTAYDVEFTLPSAVELDPGIYWVAVQVTAGTDGGINYWVITDDGVHAPGHYTDDGGATWVSNSDSYDFSFKIEGECTGGGGGGIVYCIPEGTNATRFIDNFSTTGGSDNISNMGTGFSAAGYGDFYDTNTVAQAQGETVDFSVDIEGGISGFRVWVDWNQDGVFDVTEEVAYASTSYGNSHTGTITVPADALEGDTRMRIVSHWLSTTGNVDPCATGFTYGEFEDYKFTVETVGGGGTPGETCDDSIVVTTLPYDDAGNTATYGNFYSNGDVPPLAPGAVTTGTGSVYYLSGNEVVYEYTPLENEVLNISTTNDDDWIGLWAFTGCPFTSTVGYHTSTSGATRLIQELPVTAGETYYFVISTWSPPESTDYTIHIEKVGGSGNDDCLATIYDGGNNSSAGGAVYFDVSVGPEDIELTSLNLNVDDLGSSFTVDIYTIEGTYVGNETNQAAWTLQTEGSGTSAGEGNPSSAALDDTFTLAANTTYGMALVLTSNHRHFYTNGDGTNEHFENGDLALDLGAALNVPFTGSVNSPRVFNGSLCYSVGGGGGPGHVYCIPEGTNATRFIDNFSTTGGSDNISNMSSGFSTAGYGDFYNTHTITQEQGANVEFTVDIEGGTAGFRVWVDWNQDGVFDTTEEVAYASTSYGNSHTGTITVPEDALEGDTRMRIVSHWLSTTGDVDPCATGFTYGEFEDYKFTVEEGLGVDDQSSTTFSYYPNPTNGVVNITANKDISSLAVFNILGQKVLEKDRLVEGQVDVTDLSSGTYMFRVIFEDGSTETFKVLRN